ncbi:hypothetical protein [Alysiella crassa]|nr:hypothetical protein [Alysiella crassa]
MGENPLYIPVDKSFNYFILNKNIFTERQPEIRYLGCKKFMVS